MYVGHALSNNATKQSLQSIITKVDSMIIATHLFHAMLYCISMFYFQSLFNGTSRPHDKYTRLENEVERSNQNFIEETQAQQQVNP